jgi:hypothetical protein
MNEETLDDQVNTRADLRLWTFDQHTLRPGDVVLEQGQGKFSPVIKRVDRGPFTHALLWIGGGDFLEAIGSGVRAISFARVVLREPGDWTVLRHPDAAAGESAARESRTMAHKGYDLWGAAKSPFPFARLDPTRLFCSQLVATAYERVGFSLSKEKAAHQVTPNTLVRDASLAPVEPLPILPVPADRLEWAIPLVDRNRAYKNSLMAIEMGIAQDVIAMVLPMFPAFVPPVELGLTSTPGNLYEAVALLQLMDEAAARPISERVTDELGRRNYFCLADRYLREAANRRLIENARIKVGSIRDQELQRLASQVRELQPGREATLARHEENAAAYGDMLSLRGLRLFERLRQMHMHIAMHLHLIVRNEREILEACEERYGPAGSN